MKYLLLEVNDIVAFKLYSIKLICLHSFIFYCFHRDTPRYNNYSNFYINEIKGNKRVILHFTEVLMQLSRLQA